MKKYIECEAAIAGFMQYTWYNEEGGTVEDSDMKRFILEDMFASIPTADVRENVHGEWLINSDGYYPYCSHCKEEPQGHVMTDYCPNCGAQMKR